MTEALADLDKALSLRTFLVGHAVTLADLSVWAALKGLLLLPVSVLSSGILQSYSVWFISPQVVPSGLTRASPSPMSTAGSFS